MIHFVLHDPKDTVAVVVVEGVKAGQEVTGWIMDEDRTISLQARQDIPIDHKVALTDRSLVEAAEAAGLRTVKVIPRFLPYSTKGRLPQHPLLVRLYLATPPAWWLLGRQTLYVGERA